VRTSVAQLRGLQKGLFMLRIRVGGVQWDVSRVSIVP